MDEATKYINSENIIDDFIKSNFNLKDLAKALYSLILIDFKENNKETLNNFYLWNNGEDLTDPKVLKNIDSNKRKSLGLIVSDLIDNKTKERLALFSMYTSYSIFLKLISCQVLISLNYIKKLNYINTNEFIDVITNIENGNTLNNSKIKNIIDFDYFDWYLKHLKENEELFSIIDNIISKLSIYTLQKEKISEDLFRNFYECFFDFDIRHSLGEYFTPLWLADYTIRQYENNTNFSMIDNCCGSGAFLIAGINHKKEIQNNLSQILSTVKGIDINPLSVLQAKLNYLSAISTYLKEDSNLEIEIPIYLADSCILPELKENNVCFSIKELEQIKAISIPRNIIDNKKETIDFIKTNFNIVDRKTINQVITKTKLFNILGTFDIVVGNPPWVKWGDLDNNYKKDLYELAEKHNLFSKNKYLGGNSLNICSLISYLSLYNFGNKKAKVIYIMPSDLIYQPSYEEWRKLNNKQYFEKYIYFENKNIFKDVSMGFSIYVINNYLKSDVVCNQIKISTKENLDTLISYNDLLLNNKIKITEKSYFLINGREDKNKFIKVENLEDKKLFSIISGKSNYKVRSGLGLLPKDLRLFTIKEIDYKNKIAIVETLYSIKNKLNELLTINTDYLFPVVLSENLKDKYNDLSSNKEYKYYTFLPYDFENKSKQSFLSDSVIDKLGITFYNDYLLKYQNQLSGQSQNNKQLIQTNYYGIQRIGAYTYHPIKVLIRDNTKFISSLIIKDNFNNSNLQEKTPLLNCHVSSISERIIDDNKTILITEKEAQYINAIFNLEIVKKFIENSNSPRGFELNDLGIHLPSFNEGNLYHKNILNLSFNLEKNQAEILKNYISDCVENKK